MKRHLRNLYALSFALALSFGPMALAGTELSGTGTGTGASNPENLGQSVKGIPESWGRKDNSEDKNDPKPPVVEDSVAPATEGAVIQQTADADAVSNDLMSGPKRTALMNSTNKALMLNAAMQKLVDDKKYNDKGLNAFRMGLAIQAMGAVKGLGDKPKEEPKPSRNVSMDDLAKRMGPSAAITGLMESGALADSQHSLNPQSDQSIAYVDGTPKDAATFIKQRLKEDFTKSNLVPSS